VLKMTTGAKKKRDSLTVPAKDRTEEKRSAKEPEPNCPRLSTPRNVKRLKAEFNHALKKTDGVRYLQVADGNARTKATARRAKKPAKDDVTPTNNTADETNWDHQTVYTQIREKHKTAPQGGS